MQVIVREDGNQRGSSLYHFNDGFYYYKNRETLTNTYYRCIKAPQCSATAIVYTGILQSRSSHSHPPDMLSLELRRERRAILNEAANLNIAHLKDIFSPERNNNIRFRGHLNFRSLEPAMRRARNAVLPVPPITLVELNAILVDDRFRCLCALPQFEDTVYGGSISGHDGSFIILFISKRCIPFLKMCPTVLGFTNVISVDGNPQPFHLHTIGTNFNNSAIPLAWLLMDNNTLPAYLAGFSLLRSILMPSLLKKVLCREGTEAAAYRIVFAGNVEVPFHHYIMDVVTFFTSVIPKDLLTHDTSVRHFLRMCCGLIMVPQNLVRNVLEIMRIETLTADIPVQPSLMQLLENIESRWMGQTVSGTSFSAFGSPDRTSNASQILEEIIKRKFLNGLNQDLYSCIRKIINLEQSAFYDICKLYDGQRPAVVSFSLSQDPQISVLVHALGTPPNTMVSAIHNLITETAVKCQHLIDLILNESAY